MYTQQGDGQNDISILRNQLTPQRGYGDMTMLKAPVTFQRGYAFPVIRRNYYQGRGVGSIFSSLYRYFKPLLMRGISTLGEEAIKMGSDILTNKENKPLETMVKSRGIEAYQNLKRKAKEALDPLVEGRGARKRSKRKSIKRKRQSKNLQLAHVGKGHRKKNKKRKKKNSQKQLKPKKSYKNIIGVIDTRKKLKRNRLRKKKEKRINIKHEIKDIFG